MSEYGYVLERICKIIDNIEKDLHSIDVSLGKIVVQNEKNEPKNDLKSLKCPKIEEKMTEIYAGNGVFETKPEKKMSWDEYFNGKPNENKEENNENRS